MTTEFQIPFRTIRIGSLKTFPPKNGRNNNLKLTREELKFKIVIDPKQNPGVTTETLKITIPCAGITLFEGFVGRGCPVIWVTTDQPTARKLRQATGMRLCATPVPYYDPKAKEIADQRIAIIPSEDPMEPAEISKFRTVVRQIADDKDLAIEDFFYEMARPVCNEQLVQCTRYLSRLTKFQSSFRLKQEAITETRSAIMDVKTEVQLPIVISSDEEDVAVKKEPQSPTKEKKLLKPSTSEEESKPSTSDKPAEPKAASSSEEMNKRENNWLKNENSKPKSDASPDLFDFSDEDEVVALEEDESQSSKKLDGKRRGSGDGLSKAAKKVRTNEGQASSDTRDSFSGKGTSNSDGAKLKTDNGSETAPQQKKASVQSDQFSSSKMATNSQARSPEKRRRTEGGDKGLDGQASNPITLPSSKIDLKSIRGTAALSCDMQTLHQDMESMLGATPLCICVVKSPYVINLSVANDIKCMAIDNVDGRLTGCINPITDPVMMRPSKNIPVHGMCEEHRSRMLQHECCPGCGTFCAGGTFLVCDSTAQHQHRFHRNCLMLTRHSTDCPHCGCPMSQVHEVTVDPTKLPKDKFDDEMTETGHSYPECVAKIPGVTKTIPDNLVEIKPMQLGPDRESLETMLANLELELPKKLRFQAKNLIQLVKQGDAVKVMQLLCGAGGDPNARANNNSRTALHEAVIRGHLPIIHLLVMAGADVNIEDDEGKTPVFYAEETGRIDILQYLIICNSNLGHKDCEGMMPLHHAAKNGRVESCQILLKHGKEYLNCADEGGWTPLVWAAEHRQTNTAECLLYYDADVHIVDKEGNICLQWAALAGNKDILLMCLKRNSYIDHQNMHGDTALHIAAREGNYDCIVTLLGWGAEPSMKNKEGRKPADCAPEFSMCWVSLMINSFIRNSISDHKGFVPFDRERILSIDISRGREKLPISCVNAVDEAPCPTNPPHEFLYVVKNIHKQTSVNCVLSIMKSCECMHDCTSCICTELCGNCWYDGGGHLVPAFDFTNPPAIYECNMICRCLKTCRNRVIQKGGVRFRLQVFRTRNMGWGVRALEPIERGSFVCEFIGEVISDADTKENDSYLFDLDDKPDGTYTIDGRFYGNVSRFINHHCDPNLAPVRFFVDHHDKDFPRVAFFATRNINVGEQLGYDYGDGFWDVKSQHFTCECGAKNCKYSLQAYRERFKDNDSIGSEPEN